jgi:hypothetical protein
VHVYCQCTGYKILSNNECRKNRILTCKVLLFCCHLQCCSWQWFGRNNLHWQAQSAVLTVFVISSVFQACVKILKHKITYSFRFSLCPPQWNILWAHIGIFPEFATMIILHGKLRSYLHRFGLTDNPMCRCKEEQQQQTTDHLLFQCNKLLNQRNGVIKEIKTAVAIGLRRKKDLSIIIYKFL